MTHMIHTHPGTSTPPKEAAMRIIRDLINSFHIARSDMTVLDTTHCDSLYPMVLAKGQVEVEREDVVTYNNATAIINADRSLTIAQQGEIIGWHDTDTYWRVTSN